MVGIVDEAGGKVGVSVGNVLGDIVGTPTVGFTVGDTEGAAVGASVNSMVGDADGATVGGSVVGLAVGGTDGTSVGNSVNCVVGISVGDAVGSVVGAFVSITEGCEDGIDVGKAVGSVVAAEGLWLSILGDGVGASVVDTVGGVQVPTAFGAPHWGHAIQALTRVPTTPTGSFALKSPVKTKTALSYSGPLKQALWPLFGIPRTAYTSHPLISVPLYSSCCLPE